MTQDASLDEDSIYRLLYKRYEPARGRMREWVIARHVADGTGAQHTRWADAVVMNMFPSRGNEIIGFEIKCSRTDWLTELKNPEKAEAVAAYCDRWYLVVADGEIVKDGELPIGWGLMVVKSRKKGNAHEFYLQETVKAERREGIPLTRHFMAAFLRKAAEQDPGKAILAATRREAHDEGYRRGRIDAEGAASGMRMELDRLKSAVQEFEAASGVTLSPWHGGEIGAAVSLLMRVGPEGVKYRLEHLASGFTELGNLLARALAELNEMERLQAPKEGPCPGP